jgi:hypothetical protein
VNPANEIEGFKEAEEEIGLFIEDTARRLGDLILKSKFLLPSPLFITAAGDKLIGYIKNRDDDGAIVIREAPPEREPVGTYKNFTYRPRLGDVFLACTTAASARVLQKAVNDMVEHLESKENEERSAADAGSGECEPNPAPQEQVGVGPVPEGDSEQLGADRDSDVEGCGAVEVEGPAV